jgi:hypothetical protein
MASWLATIKAFPERPNMTNSQKSYWDLRFCLASFLDNGRI